MTQRNLIGGIVCLWALAGTAGCTKSDPPRFALNMVELTRREIEKPYHQDIATALEALFGTPNEPFVLPETGLDASKIALAAGPVKSDQDNVGLYRRHCVHCHGISGDGMGPTAEILNPYPRDYRPGKYKFKTTERVEPPSDDDLQRVIKYGVHGTAMPAFVVAFDQAKLEAIVEYVKYLSIRGETEFALMNTVADLGEGEKLKLDRESLISRVVTPIAEKWKAAKDKTVQPVAKPDENPALSDDARAKLHADSIAKGRELFYGRADCRKCHGDSGQGDGQTNGYDDWNDPLAKLTKDITDKRLGLTTNSKLSGKERADEVSKLLKMEQPLSWALPVRNIIPRNLRSGIYRGGRRPIDIYCRVATGINGTPMPAASLLTEDEKKTLPADEQQKLQGERIWNLVDYVRSLPFEPISNPYMHDASAVAAEVGTRSR
jgi:mono/diheme cytochrome c family protein